MLESGNSANTVMPVQPMYGNGGGFGSGYGDGGWFWIIVLFLLCGWGNNGFGGGYGNGGNTAYIANDVQRGFDQNAVMSAINGVQTSVSNGFANAEISRCNNTANLSGQITNVGLATQMNHAATQMGIADLKYNIATEACADRQTVNDALRDVIAQNTANTQAILNQLNADKLDAKNEEISRLRQQLDMVSLADSQNQQTQQIIGALQTPAPIPAYMVPAPFGCNCGNNYGCGCGV